MSCSELQKLIIRIALSIVIMKKYFSFLVLLFLLKDTFVYSQLPKNNPDGSANKNKEEIKRVISDYLKTYKPEFKKIDSTATFNGIEFGKDFNFLNKRLQVDTLRRIEGDLKRKFGFIGNKHLTDIDSLLFIGFAHYLNSRLVSIYLESISKYSSVEHNFIIKYGMPHYFSDDSKAWVGNNIKIILTDASKSTNKKSSFGYARVEISLIHNNAINENDNNILQSSIDNKERGNIDSALLLINRYLFLYPNSANAYRVRGILKTNKKIKDYNGAIIDFTEAIALDDKDKDAYLMRGLTYRVLKMTEKACIDLRKASSLGDTDAIKFIKECSTH